MMYLNRNNAEIGNSKNTITHESKNRIITNINRIKRQHQLQHPTYPVYVRQINHKQKIKIA